MAIYSIKELAELTGVKAHTIRIWEKRHALVNPKRTSTNIRYYSDEDLKKLLNVALLNRNGFRISQIADMDATVLMEQVASITSIEMPEQEQADVLTLSLIELDSFSFERIVQTNIRQIGFERTMMEIIYPFMEKLGLLWFSGAMNQAHEKFLNTILRQIILAEIDRLPSSKKGVKVLLFLPEGNQQELSLLFSQFLLKKRGLQIINLGTNCDIDDIAIGVKTSRAKFVFTMNVDDQHLEFSKYIEGLTNEVICPVIVSGGAIELSQLAHIQNLIRLEGMDDTLDYVGKLALKLERI